MKTTRTNLMLALCISVLTIQGCASAGSKRYSYDKTESFQVGITTMEEAKRALGSPLNTYINNAQQARQFVRTKTHKVIPEDYLQEGEYSVWYYWKVTGRGAILASAKRDGILIFDDQGKLVKIEEGSEE